MEQYKTFEMRLNEIRAAFETEKNAKNECYLYILQRGLFDDYAKWFQQRQSNGNVFDETMKELCKKLRGGKRANRPQRQTTRKNAVK